MTEPPRSLKDLFLAALNVEPEARAAWLDQQRLDPAQRRHLNLMLEAHDAPQSLLDQPSPIPSSLGGSDSAAPTIDAEFVSPGVSIGPYKLIEPIGEGGMGSVWMARQTEPIKRLVAVKLIKAGMDSKQVLSRFEAERQALALMDHPNIARVLDAGATGDGRPYFVMELVKGIPITKYCDERQLTPRQRLELFVPVCQAIQHAHQKGIIHRDIKPSNVLVAMYDDRPSPKVIDFGVAKAAGQQLTEGTLQTGFGAVVGTLEYMSPEQASFNQLDVDTRSDIYSLGVLLYELLAGSPPFGKMELANSGMLEMLRVIREQEPSKPSTRISTADGLPALAANRGTEPARLTKQVRGELDWIVMKSLEKDRSRRYETANGFAADVQRYLNDEAVQACPPSAAYRLRKFARRNKGTALAAVLILLTLVVGSVGTTIGLLEARSQRDAAEAARLDEEREKIRAVAAEKLASDRLAQVEAERAIAQAISDFLQKDLLGQAYIGNQAFGPGAPKRDPKITVRELLDRAEKAIVGKFADQPLVEASVRQTLSDTYSGLGDFEVATKHAQRALDLRRGHAGPDDGGTLESMNNFGMLNLVAGNVKKASEILEDVLRRKKEKYGPDAPETLVTKQHLALAYWGGQRWNDSITLMEQVRAVRIIAPGVRHRDTVKTLSVLATFYAAVGKVDEALDMLLPARDALSKVYGPDDPELMMVVGCLGEVYLRGNRTTEAIEALLKTRDSLVRTLNADHPQTLAIITNIAAAYEIEGKFDEALPHLQQAASGIEKLKFQHVSAGDIVGNLSRHLERRGQYRDAETWRRKWLAFVKERDGPESGPYAGALLELGDNLLKQKKYADAEPLLTDARRIVTKLQPRAWTTFWADALLGEALLGQKKYPEAEPLLLSGCEGMEQRESKISPQSRIHLIEALERLVQLYDATGQKEKSAEWSRKLAARREADLKSAKTKAK